MLNTRGSKRFSRKTKVIAAIIGGFAAISIVNAVASGGKGVGPAAKPAAGAPGLTNTQASVAVCKALNAGLPVTTIPAANTLAQADHLAGPLNNVLASASFKIMLHGGGAAMGNYPEIVAECAAVGVDVTGNLG